MNDKLQQVLAALPTIRVDKPQQQRQIALAAVAVLGLASLLWYRRRSRRYHGDDDDDTAAATAQYRALPRDPPADVPLAVWKAFVLAVERIQHVTRRLKSGDKLMLYALYKQVLVGDAPETFNASKAAWNVIVEKAKYDAWCGMRGMSRGEAAVHYVTAVSALDTQGDDDDEDEGDDEDWKAVSAPAVSRPVDAVTGEDDEGDGDDASKNNAARRFLEAAGDDSQVAALEQMLKDGVATVEYADAAGQTALHLAADKGACECLKLLLSQPSANASACDRDGISVLQAAVIAGHVQACQLLLEAGADPDQADLDGDTPRSCALDDGSPEICQLFDAYDENGDVKSQD